MARRSWLTVGLLTGLGLGWPVQAADVSKIEVGHGHGRYRLSMEAYLSAPPGAVFSVITDYENIHRLHRRIRESRVTRRLDARTVEVYTRMHGCVAALFCKTLRRVERVTESPPEEITAIVLPQQSDFRSGRVLWRLRPEGEGTILRYENHMEPDFWVPGLLGDDLLARSLLRTARDMIERVEALARERVAGAPAHGRQE